MAKATVRQDNFPNYMSWSITETAPDTFTTDKIFTPIPRNQMGLGNKAIVMELLWLDVYITNISQDVETQAQAWGLVTGGVPIVPAFIDQGNVICNGAHSQHTVAVATGATSHTSPFRIDLQSKDGYGYLLATDAFHAWVLGLDTGIAATYKFRLYYRFVRVPVTEFIGLVQSQQTS